MNHQTQCESLERVRGGARSSEARILPIQTIWQKWGLGYPSMALSSGVKRDARGV